MPRLQNAPLSQYGTFQLGGPCRELIHCRSQAEAEEAVRDLASDNADWLLIGGGSNLLFSDAGWPGTLLRYCRDDEDLELDAKTGQLRVGAAMPLDALAVWTVANGWIGVENCSGIPGTVGGAVAGNAGAWGRQIGDVVLEGRLITTKGDIRRLDHAAFGFVYRDSVVKHGSDLLLDVTLQLQRGDAAELAAERERILALRTEKHPDLSVNPCIGSIFRNLEPSSAAGRRRAAGFFLEEAGAKDMQVGGARVFEKHANIIVKGPDCRAQDVHDLCAMMQAAVRDHSGIELEREVRFLGEFEGSEARPSFF